MSLGRQSSPGCVALGRNFDCRFLFLNFCFQRSTLHRNHLASGAAATKLGSGDTHRYSNCFVPPSSYLLLGLPVPFYQFRDSVTVEKID